MHAVLIEVLHEQLRKDGEREQQVQQEKTRLLSLLEAEQVARRELETKLLPAPRPTAVSKGRLWALAILLLVALAGLVITLMRPELIGGLTGGNLNLQMNKSR